MKILKLTRRDFLRKIGISTFFIPSLLESQVFLHEALYYRKIDKDTFWCQLCPRKCILTVGKRSFCRVREAKNDKLYTLVYGTVCAVHVDPIEKKPIYHMLPGSFAFSIATAGCNLRCKYCQNWQISQVAPEKVTNIKLSPQQVIEKALANNCRSIAYTYSEPTIFYEYMLDIAKLAKKKGIKNIYVTGTYINPEPLKELCEYIDACNADLKAFSDDVLIPICQSELLPTLEALKIIRSKNILLEITNLILPGLNDNLQIIKQMCNWIKTNLGENIPLHFSRFYPQYKMTNLPFTPISTLKEAKKVAMDSGLNHVYIGNVPQLYEQNTICPQCKKIVIKRYGYTIEENNLKNEKCKYCQYEIYGIWN